MPKPPSGKTYEKKYTEKDLLAAVTAIKDGMPKREAARKFGIPRATLQFRLSSDLIKTRPGPSTILTETEENKLADWIITSSKKGFPRRKEDVLHSVEQFMIKAPRESKFKDNKPGEGWYRLFLKRHPEIAERTAEAVTSASANVSEENVRNWFKQIENTLTDEERKIVDDPSRIFNGDETGFQLCPKQGKVLAEKGSRVVYEIDMAAAKSSITVMFTFSASGKVTPPLVIYPLKRMREDIRRSVPPHWGIALSDSGWMTKEIFFQYVANILYPHLLSEDITFPVILFVDGHKSHINYQLSEKCKELGIVLVALYPNATRILQPADVAAFKPIKNEWRKALLEWRRNNFAKQLTKIDFGRVLTTVVANIKKDVIINGFKACGLHPWNPNAINYAKCLGKQKDADPAPCYDRKLTITDFQSLVGSDIFSALQNETSFQDSNFYKALENIYKFLKDETVFADIPNSYERRIRIDDEWLPIDDLPFLMKPGAGEGVEKCITVTSDKNSSLFNNDILIKVRETDLNERCAQKISLERKNVLDEKHFLEDIEKIENVTDMKNLMMGSEIIKEDNHTQLENQDNNGYDLDKICIKTIETDNNEEIQENLKKLEQIFGKLGSTDGLHKTTSPAKIDDFLYKAPTPKRKGKILSNHSSIYVMTSDKWLESEKNKQDEKEKAIAEKLERKRNRDLVKQAKLLKKEETQNKNKNKRKCTDEQEIQGKICKKRKTGVKKSKDKENITNQTDTFSSPKMANITETEIINVNENQIKIDAQKNNKRQNTLKSNETQIDEDETDTVLTRKVTDKTQNKEKNETETSLTKVTEITKINVSKEKATLVNTKIQAKVCKNRKKDSNKNKKEENETKKLLTEKAKILTPDKITAFERKKKIYVEKNNKRQCILKYETEPTLTSKMTDEAQSKKRNKSETTLPTITKINTIMQKTETIKQANENNRINVISVIPISVNPADNVKRRLFDSSCTVKPSEFVLKPPKIVKRRSTFRNEEELQEYLNKEYDNSQ